MITGTEKIRKDILDRMHWDSRVDVSDIRVEVSDDGIVRLSGTVPTFRARQAALDKNVSIDTHLVKVYVKVEDGKVMLSGNVPNWAVYEAVLNIAYYTPGVVDVIDNLIIGST